MAIPRFNATMRNLEYRLRKFKDDLPVLLPRIIKELEPEIVSTIADEQLYAEGINGGGVEIASYRPYAESTIRRKIRKGQPTDRVTLRDTGAFHKEMHVVFDEEGFYITSENFKTPFLVSRYGPKIFRLTDENFTRIVRERVRKELVKRLKESIKG